MNRVLVAILFLLLPAFCPADDLFDIKPVADGVYAAIAKPTYKSIATLRYRARRCRPPRRHPLQAFRSPCPYSLDRSRESGEPIRRASVGSRERTAGRCPAVCSARAPHLRLCVLDAISLVNLCSRRLHYLLHLPDAGRRSTTLKRGVGRSVPVSVLGVALRSPITVTDCPTYVSSGTVELYSRLRIPLPSTSWYSLCEFFVRQPVTALWLRFRCIGGPCSCVPFGTLL